MIGCHWLRRRGQPLMILPPLLFFATLIDAFHAAMPYFLPRFRWLLRRFR